MERLGTIIVAAGLLLPLGCATTQSAKSTANALPNNANSIAPYNAASTVAAAPPAPSPWEQFQTQVRTVAGTEKPPVPANEFACTWQNRLQQLPDPSRGGMMIPGLVGQVFLYSRAHQVGEPDYAAAKVNGELVLVVSDATPRPATNPTPLRNEVWHFSKETLQKMVITDERFGPCIVLFLPWPDTWRDVNRVSIQARYDQPGADTLFAQPMTLTLDFTTATGTTQPTAGTAYTAIPDPRTVVQRVQNPQVAMPTGNTAIQQTGVWSPPPASMPQTGLFAPPAAPNPKVPPGSAAEFQRLVIPRQ